MYPKISEELIAKYFAKEATEQESYQIQLWLEADSQNQQLLEEFQSAWNTSRTQPNASFDKESVYQKINHAINDEKKRAQQINTRNYLRFAASILLFIGLASTWLLLSNQKAEMLTKSTEYGQKMKISLPDGSIVQLNSGSSMEYPEKFDHDNRTVQLTGEAFFEVKKNPKKPFIVETEHVQTKVLGTSFNINAYVANEPTITVASGSVLVRTDKQSVILEKNQKAFLVDQELKSENVLAQNAILWKDGILNFKDTPMKAVKSSLEKWYNVAINFEDEAIEKCVFTGQFKNEKLMIVLEVLKETFGITYEVKSKLIIIKGKGC